MFERREAHLDVWLLKATGAASRGELQTLPFGTRAAAMIATINLWKRGLRPVSIVGPNGEFVGHAEIEAFQNDEVRRELRGR